MSLETFGATDWRWRGRKLFGMAANKGESQSGSSYSGRGPSLTRTNAKKTIEYEIVGSNRRRRSRQNDDDDDSDGSVHLERWKSSDRTVENFSVHGKQDLPLMNELLRTYGLRPGSLGIDSQDYEQIKRTSSMGSPLEGYNYTPRSESVINDYSRQNSDLNLSDRVSPSPGSDRRLSLSPVGPATQRRVEPSAPLIQREQSTEARAVENRARTPSGGATPIQVPESDGGMRRPSFPGFADVAQDQNKSEENAASVQEFISDHGGPELPRQFSMPCSIENTTTTPSSETARPGGVPIPRAHSEPIRVPSLIPRETSPNVAELEIRDQESEGPSSSRRPISVLPPPVLKPLKPPPPGRRGLQFEPGQFSSMDMLNSLAPDAEDTIPRDFSASDDDSRKSDTDGEQEEFTFADVDSEQPKHLPNGTDLTIDVPDRMLQQIAQVKIDDNPEPVVPQSPVVPVGPKCPWSKGDILGQGSFGTVYDAVDSDGMWFAVKEVSMVENDKQAQQSIAQLMQEIELLSQFKHENVVQYLGTEKEHGKLYIFLELVSKGSLASICKRIKLNHSQISAYTRQILKGLKYLHERNIVHRDIKCANILVDTTGICKVADFGMAKQMQSMDQMKSCKGSAYWMAPEVIDPKKFSGLPSDIWSLGCSILEMATGAPPFGDMEWYRVLWTVGHGNAPPIPDTLSETAKDFIKQCLDINPAKRPTATELLNHPFVRQDGPSTPPSQSSVNLSAVSSSLHPIVEERSADFDRGSSTEGGNSISNGHSETASS